MPTISPKEMKLRRRLKKAKVELHRHDTMAKLGRQGSLGHANAWQKVVHETALALEKLAAHRTQLPAVPSYLRHPVVARRHDVHLMRTLAQRIEAAVAAGDESAEWAARNAIAEIYKRLQPQIPQWAQSMPTNTWGPILVARAGHELVEIWDRLHWVAGHTAEQRVQALREHRRRHRAGRRPSITMRPRPLGVRLSFRNGYTKPCTCWLCRNAHLFDKHGELR